MTWCIITWCCNYGKTFIFGRPSTVEENDHHYYFDYLLVYVQKIIFFFMQIHLTWINFCVVDMVSIYTYFYLVKYYSIDAAS